MQNMNKLILMFFLVLSSRTFAVTDLKRTDLESYQPPTAAQLEVARALLSEAIAFMKANNVSGARAKLEKALQFQRMKKAKMEYPAAFITLYDSTKINYFSSDEIRYEVDIESTCFVGTTDNALALLSAAIQSKLIGSDEDWYENPRKKGTQLIVDKVDGPNDLRQQVTIRACK